MTPASSSTMALRSTRVAATAMRMVHRISTVRMKPIFGRPQFDAQFSFLLFVGFPRCSHVGAFPERLRLPGSARSRLAPLGQVPLQAVDGDHLLSVLHDSLRRAHFQADQIEQEGHPAGEQHPAGRLSGQHESGCAEGGSRRQRRRRRLRRSDGRSCRAWRRAHGAGRTGVALGRGHAVAAGDRCSRRDR